MSSTISSHHSIAGLGRKWTLSAGVAAFITCIGTAETLTVCPVPANDCDFTSIQDAIDAANPGDVIEIAAGTYFPPCTLDTKSKAVRLRGQVDAAGNLLTVIDGSRGNNELGIRVLQCTQGEGSGTVFENLKITEGNGIPWGGNDADIQIKQPGFGGGMYCFDSNPALINCTFVGNTTKHSGGGAYFTRVDFAEFADPENLNTVPFLNCTFTDNTADGDCICCFPDVCYGERAGGGGLCLTKCEYSNSSSVIDSCIFTGNSSPCGGGLFLDQTEERVDADHPLVTNCNFVSNMSAGNTGESSSGGGGLSCCSIRPTLRNCSFTGNATTHVSPDGFTEIGGGGGMRIFGTAGTAAYLKNTRLEDCTFTDNTASAGTSGAGFHMDGNNGEDRPVLVRCDFIGNSNVGGDGGGVFLNTIFTIDDSNGTPISTFDECSFIGNSAENGGGMANRVSEPTLENCTISGNTANSSGGGIHNGSFGNPMINDCDITENSAGIHGAGMYSIVGCGCNPTLRASTFCSNTILGVSTDSNQIEGGWQSGGDISSNTITANCQSDCPADFNGDGVVNGGDFGLLLGAWGCTVCDDQDLDDNGVVSGSDIGALLSVWGPCP